MAKAKKRVSIEGRLRELMRFNRALNSLWDPATVPPGPGRWTPEMETPGVWEDQARKALTLGPDDQALKIIFAAFGLDPRMPQDWRDLLEDLTHAVFAPRERAGRRREWTFQRHTALIDAVEKLMRKGLSERSACDFLARDKNKPAYFPESGASLRSQLRIARESRNRSRAAAPRKHSKKAAAEK